ncbi:MAG: hypothetical protein NTZ67_08245 [Gammaproteobacteria bacterium]|nr:hypothetical protein [Gammaproteobacteria bacterium]
MEDNITNQPTLSRYQRTMRIALSALISGGICYFLSFIFDAIFNCDTWITGIFALIVFTLIYRFIYKNTVIYPKPISNANSNPNFMDYSPGDIHDPRNPFSSTTPGGIKYVPSWYEKDPFEASKKSNASFYNDHNRW